MGKQLIQAGQYRIPNETQQRMDFTKKSSWTAGVVLVIGLAATIYAAVTSADIGGILAMIGFDLVVAGILSWSLYWYFKHAKFVYEVLGTTVVFPDPDYYVPSPLMLRLVRSVHKAWRPHLDIDPQELYSRVTLKIVKDRPVDPAGRVDKVVGLTYHLKHYSVVWGPYALHPGGAGYELLLHGAEYKWPGSKEADKIERMKELGVFDALNAAHKDEFGT